MMTTMTDARDLQFQEPEWVDITSVSTHPAYAAVDLCCGGGLAARGFEQARYELLGGVEMDHDAAETFRLSFPGAFLIEGRMETATDEELLGAVAGRDLGLVFAGLPCQGFSLMRGVVRPEDPRNWLFAQLVRIVELLQPHAVVIENVPNMRGAADGAFARWISAALAGIGYPHASATTLLAVGYGVPQRRERLFVIANRHGLPNPFPWPLVDERSFATVRDAIADLADHPDDEALNHVRSRHRPETVARMDRLRPGESLSQSYKQAWKRLRPDAPAPTVIWGNGSIMVHPWLPRALTVREAARLQGVPDDHRFVGDRTAQGTQVANGVPTPLARAVALALRALLDEVA
jgi:DNA (cytosine-5)-methyltransferase 1